MTGRAVRNMVRLLVAITLAVCGFCIEPETTASAPHGDIVAAYTYDDHPIAAVLASAIVDCDPSTTHDRIVYDADRWSRGAPARFGEAAPAAPTTYDTHSSLWLVERMTPTTQETAQVADGRFAVFDRVRVAAKSESFVYRGVSREHPGYGDALQGKAVPRNVNGSTTAEAHNYGNAGDLADSPFTSWTRDPAIARRFAGDDGVILRLPTGKPPAGSSWKFDWSPDVWFEQAVLVRGPVSGAGRIR